MKNKKLFSIFGAFTAICALLVYQIWFAPLSSASFQTLSQALTQIGASSRTLVVTTSLGVTDNTTVPANVHLDMKNGGGFVLSSGKVLTIKGPFNAGLYQAFSGAGTVSFAGGQVGKMYPEWWGALRGGAAATNATAIQVAFDAALEIDGTIHFSIGTYAYNGAGLRYSSLGIFEGEGWRTILDYQGDNVALAVNPRVNTSQGEGMILRNFRLTTTAGSPVGGLYIGSNGEYSSLNVDYVRVSHFDNTDSYGLRLEAMVSSKFNNCTFDANYYNLYMGEISNTFVTSTTFSNCRFRVAIKHGAYIRQGTGIEFVNNTVFESNQGSGLYVSAGSQSPIALSLIRVVGCHFENNMTDNNATDFDIALLGLPGDPLANFLVSDTTFVGADHGGGHIKYENVWRLKVYRNTFSAITAGHPTFVTVSNPTPQSNYDIEWVGNSGGDDSTVNYRGNDTYQRDMYSSVGMNLRKVGSKGTSSYYSTHQLKGASVTNGLIGDNTTQNTIASLLENSQGAGEVGGGLVLVSAWNDAKTGRFIDVVAFAYGAASVLHTYNAVGSPPARTYSVADNVTLQVLLANSGDNTYNSRVSQLTN
jgi:hypothetical protein